MIQNYIVNKNEELFLPLIWTGKEKEINYNVSLNEEGASIKLLMLVLGTKENFADININITHDKPHTKSQIIVRGIIGDASRVNFNGLVKINKGSILSNAWLAAHFLLTSDKAKGRAVPSLEILENDIKAGHATTVGKINDTEVFYLMSRGLTKKRAKQIVVSGFVTALLSEFPETLEKTNALKLIKSVI